MPEMSEAATRPRRGWADKREAIIAASRTVFGRDGYSRASIDAIAAEASVSTRTIYNHFTDKENLFLTVILESATQVADAQIAHIHRYLDKVTDLESDLLAFGRVWAGMTFRFVEHFALVRQINAEVNHIPQATLDAWQEAGPRRVRRELARSFERLADKGLLRIDDPERAVGHFVVLVATEVVNRSYHGAVPVSDADVNEIATAGVRAFLYGYLPPAAER
jgi:AcrR family transcriptional regulator